MDTALCSQSALFIPIFLLLLFSDVHSSKVLLTFLFWLQMLPKNLWGPNNTSYLFLLRLHRVSAAWHTIMIDSLMDKIGAEIWTSALPLKNLAIQCFRQLGVFQPNSFWPETLHSWVVILGSLLMYSLEIQLYAWYSQKSTWSAENRGFRVELERCFQFCECLLGHKHLYEFLSLPWVAYVSWRVFVSWVFPPQWKVHVPAMPF